MKTSQDNLHTRAEQNASLCFGATVVELLTVLLIVTVMAVGLSMAITVTLAYEQNYREEASVRTTLAMHLEYAERYLSLASNVFIGASSTYEPGFRPETGGVSFETGQWVRVQACVVSQTGDVMIVSIVSDDDRHPPQVDQEFSAYGILHIAPAVVSSARIEGAGAVRRLALEASFPVRTRRGVETNTITVSRPVRISDSAWPFERRTMAWMRAISSPRSNGLVR